MVPRRESFVFFFGFRFLGPSRLFVRPGTFPLSPRFGFFVVPVFGWVRLPLLCFTSASLPLRKLEGQTLPCLTRSLVTRGRDTPPYKQVSFVGLACPVYQPPGRRLRTRSWCVSSCGPLFVFRRRELHWEHRLAEPPPRLPPSLWTLGPREEPLLALFRRLVTRPFRRAGGPLSLTPFLFRPCFLSLETCGLGSCPTVTTPPSLRVPTCSSRDTWRLFLPAGFPFTCGPRKTPRCPPSFLAGFGRPPPPLRRDGTPTTTRCPFLSLPTSARLSCSVPSLRSCLPTVSFPYWLCVSPPGATRTYFFTRGA